MSAAPLGSSMSDRSEETTTSRDARSTDELLAETERLLSESGDGAASESGGSSGGGIAERDAVDPEATGVDDGTAESGPWWRRSSADAGTEAADDGIDATDAADSSGRSLPSISGYFSPKAFLALVLALGAAFLLGGTVLPIVGRYAGIAIVAFLVGLAASKRRYLEMGAAGASVGAIAAVLNYAVIAIAGSSLQTITAVGATAGAGACLISYYFGRDLRDGLVRDLD